MSHSLLRVLALLAGLALIASVVAGLTAFSLGFGADAPLPREAAIELLVLAGGGALGSGLALWALIRHLNLTAPLKPLKREG